MFSLVEWKRRPYGLNFASLNKLLLLFIILCGVENAFIIHLNTLNLNEYDHLKKRLIKIRRDRIKE